MPKVSVLRNRQLLFNELKRKLNDHLKLVLVFGSFARGDMGVYSDLDLLVVGELEHKEKIQTVLDEILEKYGVYTDLVYMAEQEFKTMKNVEPLKSLLDEGIIISGGKDI